MGCWRGCIMKKKILVLLLLLFSFSALYSLEGEFSLSLGVLGLGFNTNFETIGGYGYGRILNFMYQSDTGFGLSISPLVFFHYDKDNYSLTFVNGLIFYNFLITTNENFILGPAIAVNAVRYGDPAFVELRSGLIFSWRSFDIDYARGSIFAIDIFFVEAGHKYNKIDGHGFYAYIGFDLVNTLKIIGILLTSEEYANYRKETNPPWQP